MARRDEQDERNRRYGPMDPDRERESRMGEGRWGRRSEDEERYGRSDNDWRNRAQQRGGEHEYDRGFDAHPGERRGELGREGPYGYGRDRDRENERFGGTTGRGRGSDEYEPGGGYRRSYGEPGQMRYGREYDDSDRFGRDWRRQDSDPWNPYGREGQFGPGGRGRYGRQDPYPDRGPQGGSGQWGQGQWGDEHWRGGRRDEGFEHRGEMGGRPRDGEHEDERWSRGQHRNDEEQRRSWRQEGQNR